MCQTCTFLVKNIFLGKSDQAQKQEVIPFDDEEMGSILKKNFEDFANKKKMAEESRKKTSNLI